MPRLLASALLFIALSAYATGPGAQVLPGAPATLLGSLAGRTLGILAATGAAVWMGLHLPAPVRWRELTVVALAASTGFTFTLFFATTLYPAGPLLAELKLGALLSGSGVLLALVAARLLHVGRFASRKAPAHARPHAHVQP